MSEPKTEVVDAELADASEGKAESLPLAIRPGDKVAPPAPAQPLTAAQAKINAVADLTAKAYEKASQLQLTPEESSRLQASFPDEAFRTGASGKENLIYIEHAALRQRLNEVFGLGQWAIIPRSRWAEAYTFTNSKNQVVEATRVYVEAMLLVRGCFVAEAVGDMTYYPKNDSQNYGDAVEGAKTAALRRCCKELGVGLQAWSKEWCDGWWVRRRGGAPPPPQRPPAPPKSEPPPPKTEAKPVATEIQRTKMVTELADCVELATEYFRKAGQLLETEPLEQLPLRFCPATTNQMKALKERIAAFGNGEDATAAFPANEEPEPPKATKKAAPDDRPQVCGLLSRVSEKSGQSGRGPWTRYGLLVCDQWYNTFDSKIGERAKQLQGGTVRVFYKQTDKGMDCLELEAA